MSVSVCDTCAQYIDEDYDLEHFAICAIENGVCPKCESQIEQIFEKISPDQNIMECVQVKCKNCVWTDDQL